MHPGGVEQAGSVVGGGGRIIWKLFPGLPASPPAGEAEEEVLSSGGRRRKDGRVAPLGAAVDCLPEGSVVLNPPIFQKEVLC